LSAKIGCPEHFFNKQHFKLTSTQITEIFLFQELPYTLLLYKFQKTFKTVSGSDYFSYCNS